MPFIVGKLNDGPLTGEPSSAYPQHTNLCAFPFPIFFFGRINVLFAYLPKSVLAPVQTTAWWQAVVWTLDARIRADSSFYTFRVKSLSAGQERKLFPHHRQPPL